MNLLKETIKLIRQSDCTKVEIAKRAKVSIRLVHYLARNEKRGYDVVKVQRIYDKLSKDKQ